MPHSTSLSQTIKMLKATLNTLLLLGLVGAVDALYKRWIPDTNYENKTNWDKGDVPCGNDRVQFPAQSKVSVFVETAHAVLEMKLPINGELILNSGAGFYVVAGKDPDCGAGVTAQFADPEPCRWFDPSLWQAAASLDDLQRGDLLFSVHGESVPCQHDDVVFRPRSSFRVDTGSGPTSIPVKSVSVLGKTFEVASEFALYLGSHSGRLQFPGSSAVTVGNPGCEDPSGCECGNSENLPQICTAVTCPPLSCKKPLPPVGHCCEVCGAILAIRYSPGFNLRVYRQRIQHLFLIQPQYKSIRLGMSKVFKSQRLMGFVPFGSSAEIQVVLLDEGTGSQSEALAWDIVEDARSHGSILGIVGVEFEASTGGSSDDSGSGAGMVVGIVFGVLIMLALVIVMVVLIRKGVVRMPSLPSLSLLRSNQYPEDLDGPLDRGFDNPIFDKPNMLPDVPGLYGAEAQSISLTQTGVHFVNPAYDENETDFTA